MRYIKGIVDVGLIFEKDDHGKHECTGFVDSDYVENLDKCRSPNMVCIHSVTGTSELVLYFISRGIIDDRSRIYGNDRGYEGGELTSRVDELFGNQT